MLNYSASLEQAFQALADPTRRTLLEHLCGGPRSVSELAEPLKMTLPGVLQHLQVLEAGGLVASEKVGRVRTCRLRPEGLREVEGWIAERRRAWERRLDRLGAYLEAGGAPPSEDPQGEARS